MQVKKFRLYCRGTALPFGGGRGRGSSVGGPYPGARASPGSGCLWVPLGTVSRLCGPVAQRAWSFDSGGWAPSVWMPTPEPQKPQPLAVAATGPARPVTRRHLPLRSAPAPGPEQQSVAVATVTGLQWPRSVGPPPPASAPAAPSLRVQPARSSRTEPGRLGAAAGEQVRGPVLCAWWTRGDRGGQGQTDGSHSRSLTAKTPPRVSWPQGK